jgi:small GTP-binding protein
LDTGQQVKLQIWDSAGQERFRSLTSSYFRGADAICLVYDITSRQSFHNLHTWLQFIQKTTQESFLYVVIGNKSDLSQAHRQVSEEEGATFAASLSGGFFETSAKTALHLGEVFDFLAKEIVRKGRMKYEPRLITLADAGDAYPLVESEKSKRR